MKKIQLILFNLLFCIGGVLAQNKPVNLVFFGSSVCYGAGAKDSHGYAWQFYHSGVLDTSRYAYYNVSTGGDNTLSVEKEQRLQKKLYPTKPDIAVIGLSLGNEGILIPKTDDGRKEIVEQFRSRLLALVDSLNKQGIKPVIANCYANSDFFEPHYEYTKRINQLINSWDFPSINLLGAINDGEGKWADGFETDPWHPNTQGHREMYLSIVPSLFDAIQQGKKTPVYDWNKSYSLVKNPGKRESVFFDVEDTVHSFTMSFRFKNAKEGVLARLITGQGNLDVNVTDRSISYAATECPFYAKEGEWTLLCISHNYASQQTLFSVNGEVLARIRERLSPSRFVFGGTLDSVALKDLCLHRSSLNEDEIKDLNNKLFIQSSLEVYTPMTSVVDGMVLQNNAQSLTNLKLGHEVSLEFVEVPLY